MAFKVLKTYTPWDQSAYFYNLIQQSRVLFTDFLTKVKEAVEQRVDPGPKREMLIKQLIWEGLNLPTNNSVAVIAMKTFING